MTSDLLAGLQLPQDLPKVRAAIEAELAAGRSPAPLLAALAVHPVALAELVISPRTAGGEEMARAALTVLDALEKAISPAGLYHRLLKMADRGPGPARCAILAAALARHPEAPWLIPLSAMAEGALAGRMQVIAARHAERLLDLCRAHAQAGHAEGLVAAAGESGAAEPALALLEGGADDAAAQAAVRALENASSREVVERLAAAWGPEPAPLLARMLPHLRDQRTAGRLRAFTRWFPDIDARLRALLPALPA